MFKIFKTLAAILGLVLALAHPSRPDAAASSFVFTVPIPAVLEIGTPMKIEWRADNIPEGATLVLWVSATDRNMRPSAVARLTSGTLTDVPIPLSNGDGLFLWNGHKIAGNPADAVAFYEISEGEFRIGATVYAPGDVRIFSATLSKHRNPEVITRAETSPFLVREAGK